jgi:hypothetical protein
MEMDDEMGMQRLSSAFRICSHLNRKPKAGQD